MMQDEDKFEEGFSNWAKTVLCLKNTRDSSIGFIKHKMIPFVDELVQMHGANEKSHFEEILIKVVVNGEVKKTNTNKGKNTWTLYDNTCTTCVNVFQKILDNFHNSCSCKRWARHASKQTIAPSNYWWIISKLYISHNCAVETTLEPESVEPLAVFSLISRCKLFHENLIWFDVGQVIQCRHELMHSVDNCLSGDKKDKYCSEMKTLIKKVTVDNSITEVLHSFDKVENTTIALFTEDGEIHQLADKALKLQEESLNADFKLPKGVHAIMKSLAMSSIEIKRQELKLKLKYTNQLEKQELERKYEESEKKANQYKIDALELKLQHETEKNKGYEDNLTELKSNIENELKGLKQEKRKHDSEMFSLKNTVENKVQELQHEKSKQDNDMSSLKSTVDDRFKEVQQESSKQNDEMCSLKSTIDKRFTEMTHGLKLQMNKISLVGERLPSFIYKVKSFNDTKVRIMSDDRYECNITDMCQMPDGTVLLIDKSNMKLKRLDDKFNVTDFYQFNEIPVSVVSVSSTEVVVLDESRKLNFLRITSKITLDKEVVIERTVANESIGCIIFVNDQFWIQTGIDCINIYSSSGSFVKSLQMSSILPMPGSICTNRDKTRVYVVSFYSVHVLDTRGEELFTFKINHEFSSITCTPDDVILISSNTKRAVDMHNIVGSLLGELILETQMLSFPQSSLYDEKKQCLIIGYNGTRVRVFKLQKQLKS